MTILQVSENSSQTSKILPDRRLKASIGEILCISGGIASSAPFTRLCPVNRLRGG